VVNSLPPGDIESDGKCATNWFGGNANPGDTAEVPPPVNGRSDDSNADSLADSLLSLNPWDDLIDVA